MIMYLQEVVVDPLVISHHWISGPEYSECRRAHKHDFRQSNASLLQPQLSIIYDPPLLRVSGQPVTTGSEFPNVRHYAGAAGKLPITVTSLH